MSVITPSYNCMRFIKETVSSVQSQTYGNWEMIIVDDCSTDGTFSLLQQLSSQDSRIRVFQNERNCGAAMSRNLALRMSYGRYIAFLDSDDLWDSQKLERQVAFMQQHGCDFSYTRYREVDELSQPTGIMMSGPQRVSHSLLMRYNWLGCLTVMYDAHAVGLVQIADIRKRNDYALWLQVSKKVDCHLLDECLASYRRRTGSLSSSGIADLLKYHYQLFHIAERKCALVSCLLALSNLPYGVMKKFLYRRKNTSLCTGHFLPNL